MYDYNLYGDRGQGYAPDGILMNAVDTGWISDENPLVVSRGRAPRCMLQYIQ